MLIKDNNINRRAAFWDNWRFAISQDIRQFDADCTGKFMDDDDKITASQLREIFAEAYVIALKRFHKVLGEQINAIDEAGIIQEAEHE